MAMPTVRIGRSFIDLYFGANFNLTCQILFPDIIGATPYLYSRWVYNGSTLLSSMARRVSPGRYEHTNLEFEYLEEEELGNYSCEVAIIVVFINAQERTVANAVHNVAVGSEYNIIVLIVLFQMAYFASCTVTCFGVRIHGDDICAPISLEVILASYILL